MYLTNRQSGLLVPSGVRLRYSASKLNALLVNYCSVVIMTWSSRVVPTAKSIDINAAIVCVDLFVCVNMILGLAH